MKLSTRDLTFFALTLAALIAGGYALYLVSRTLPLPGVKYLILSPYLSLVLMMLLYKVPKKGAILLFNAGFAGIMSLINPVMSLSILCTAALSELIYRMADKRLSPDLQHSAAAASYAAFTVLTAILFAYWLTDVLVYELIGPAGTLMLTGVALGLGLVGARVGLSLRKRLKTRP